METDLPIAEIFSSIQGEGQWVGTPMLFVRLAGCNVGKPARALKITDPFPILPTGKEASVCTSWDGRSFPCDTDYGMKFKATPQTIMGMLEDSGENHICITGGEPLLHHVQIENLFALANRADVMVHIETSGTIRPQPLGTFKKLLLPGYWITCSPKINALDEMIIRADELKLLVDEGFNESRLTPAMSSHKNVFVCPINNISEVKHDNVERCLQLLKSHPNWRLSVQLHKFFGWR